jgi:hypothetical protein
LQELIAERLRIGEIYIENLPNYAYFKGKIRPYSEAKVGILTHALNYGTAAFAGVRAYWNLPIINKPPEPIITNK